MMRPLEIGLRFGLHEVKIRVSVGVSVRVMVRALIKCAFARHAAHFVKCAE